MKALWQRYAGRFDALSLRERAMIGAAAMVAVLAVAYVAMIEPEILKERRTSAAILQKQSEVRALEAQVTKLIASRAGGPAATQGERLSALRGELGELEARIAAEERRFTAPAQMRSVIEEVVARSRGVQLVELKSLGAAPIGAPEAKGAPAAKAKEANPAEARLIYRHGLEISVAGSYLDLLAYVRDLEALPTQLYWASLSLDAGGYPRLLLKLTVYTLSLDRAWLHV